MTPGEQAHVFLAMTLCGMALGVVYDVLAPFRRVKGMCAVADLLFGLICAAGIILTALGLCCEPFRLYTFAGAACGMALYGVTIGNILRRIERNVRNGMHKSGEKCKKGQSAAGI